MAEKINLKGSRKKGNIYLNPVPTYDGISKLLPIFWLYLTNKAESTQKKPWLLVPILIQ